MSDKVAVGLTEMRMGSSERQGPITFWSFVGSIERPVTRRPMMRSCWWKWRERTMQQAAWKMVARE